MDNPNTSSNSVLLSKEQLKNHILNLYLFALSDGEFAPEELEVILEIAEDKGISKQDFEQIVSNPAGVKFCKPTDFIQVLTLLYDFVLVILADGIIKKEEVDTFIRVCAKFDILEEEAKALFEWLVSLANKKMPAHLLEKEIQEFIKQQNQ